jgi:hypothetical protein
MRKEVTAHECSNAIDPTPDVADKLTVNTTPRNKPESIK